MTINLSVPATHELKPRISVFGVGGAGGNAVNNMITSHLEGVEFVVANTDAQALAQSLTERRVQLGTNITQGLGAGARPTIGRQAAEEALETIQEHLAGCNMVFITCGMGGGTGTGAAPVIAKAARECNILTVGVVTKPFQFEGKHRMKIAEAGIAELQQMVDTLIIIPNQNLFRVATERTTFADAFRMADDVLYSGVRGVTDLMVMPGLINLDFADVRAVMMEMGKAMMGTGEAEGDKRSLDAAEAAINNPLLDDVSLRGARGVLVNITGGPDMTLFEVDEACNHIRDQVDPDSNIIFGSTFDEGLAGQVRVSVVATGIDDEEDRSVAAQDAAHADFEDNSEAEQETSTPDAALRSEETHEGERTFSFGQITEIPEMQSESEPAYAETALAGARQESQAAERREPMLAGVARAPERSASAERPQARVSQPQPKAEEGGKPRLFDWMRRPAKAQSAPASASPTRSTSDTGRGAERPESNTPAPVREDIAIPPFLRRQQT